MYALSHTSYSELEIVELTFHQQFKPFWVTNSNSWQLLGTLLETIQIALILDPWHKIFFLTFLQAFPLRTTSTFNFDAFHTHGGMAVCNKIFYVLHDAPKLQVVKSYYNFPLTTPVWPHCLGVLLAKFHLQCQDFLQRCDTCCNAKVPSHIPHGFLSTCHHPRTMTPSLLRSTSSPR